MLTARATTLIECNVVRRTALPRPVNAQVYELTEIGREVQPAIRELIRWGGRFLFPPVPGDTFEPDWVMLGLDAIAKRSPVPEMNVGLVVTHGKKSAGFTAAGSGSGTAIQRGIADCKGIPEARLTRRPRLSGKAYPFGAQSRRSAPGSPAPLRWSASFPFCSTLRNAGA